MFTILNIFDCPRAIFAYGFRRHAADYAHADYMLLLRHAYMLMLRHYCFFAMLPLHAPPDYAMPCFTTPLMPPWPPYADAAAAMPHTPSR